MTDVTPSPAQAAGISPGDELIAIGILMERLRLDYERALEKLREQAKTEDKQVSELAAHLVDAANRLNSIPR